MLTFESVRLPLSATSDGLSDHILSDTSVSHTGPTVARYGKHLVLLSCVMCVQNRRISSSTPKDTHIAVASWTPSGSSGEPGGDQPVTCRGHDTPE